MGVAYHFSAGSATPAFSNWASLSHLNYCRLGPAQFGDECIGGAPGGCRAIPCFTIMIFPGGLFHLYSCFRIILIKCDFYLSYDLLNCIVSVRCFSTLSASSFFSCICFSKTYLFDSRKLYIFKTFTISSNLVAFASKTRCCESVHNVGATRKVAAFIVFGINIFWLDQFAILMM